MSVVVLLQVRVYIDGQLAGFYPISYTMYTVSVMQNALIQLTRSIFKPHTPQTLS
jgi:hypothetical protein